MNVLKNATAWRDASLILSVATIFGGFAVLGHDFWQQRHNITALKSLADSAIKQVEYNMDYAILAAFEAAEKAPEPCISGAEAALQSIVHSGSNLKDVIILGPDGRQLCSAFPGPDRQTQVSNGVPARNDDFALHRLVHADRNNLGVSWKASIQLSYLVALDIDAQLFSTLPSEIRDDSRNSIEVSGLGEIAEFGRKMDETQSVVVTSRSERFPVSAVLKLDNTRFAKWNGENRWLAAAFGFCFGLMVGGLGMRELSRPISPRETLRRAISNHEIVPFAQATFDLATRKVTGCEILMRWIKPDGSVVSPAQFIPLAEATNMIVPMTRHIMELTLDVFAPYLRKNREFSAAFNIVPADFISPNFAPELLQITKKAGVATRQIVLEITERQTIDSPSDLRAAVLEVRNLGFKVALDDMGTGHNGLSSVQDVPLDVIKIDKKFVDVVGKEDVADAIIALLVGLANKLGLKTTAEGIETEDQLRALSEVGVTHGQGYLVGKPLPLPDFLASQEKGVGSQAQNALRSAA